MNGNEICTVQTRKVNLCEEIKRDIENLQAGDMRGIIGYFSMKSDGREGNEGGDIYHIWIVWKKKTVKTN